MADYLDMTGDKVPSPCVRNCCLDDKDICLGCNRSLHEILDWHYASNDEKRAILQRCEQRRQQRPNPGWRHPRD
jgi:predicted Fe-S protein YdhL (DUF1289 family)